ncbi:hypothetical protein NSK_002028 [Nannochloropsis salina CCMP1776]|uniref:Uncharacterized protein n=1 Tax=Nannochloropsis salina CCMP1776 TaxID=1027361 RepID=A0A4D9D657_9STRA|nr:hypothetical protein NSK_002028 [Nannochloropsis salina CCMP1776]|eukprot:TFJ86940.1 hypothetical protein NSK_002028 [Nannochloropsis salina CCMP1776]
MNGMQYHLPPGSYAPVQSYSKDQEQQSTSFDGATTSRAIPQRLMNRYRIVQTLCEALKAEPACVSLTHVFHLLKHAKYPQARSLTNAILITAWGDLNDLLYAFGGLLPYEIYDKVLEMYGEDAALLMINCDNSWLSGSASYFQNPSRRVPLLDSLQALRESVTAETEGEAYSLCQFLLWKSGQLPGRVKGENGFTDFQDVEVLGQWMRICVNACQSMGGGGG